MSGEVLVMYRKYFTKLLLVNEHENHCTYRVEYVRQFNTNFNGFQTLKYDLQKKSWPIILRISFGELNLLALAKSQLIIKKNYF